MLRTPVDAMELETLAREVGAALRKRGDVLVTAESCTGGWVAVAVTAISGSSEWFDRGFVTYSDAAKQDMVGVAGDILASRGAVSEATARAMATGALTHSAATVALAITGVAGPAGGSADKPVGTVCFAWANRQGVVRAETQLFVGDRETIRWQSVKHALTGVRDMLNAGTP